jgi:hypothetical protein
MEPHSIFSLSFAPELGAISPAMISLYLLYLFEITFPQNLNLQLWFATNRGQ